MYEYIDDYTHGSGGAKAPLSAEFISNSDERSNMRSALHHSNSVRKPVVIPKSEAKPIQKKQNVIDEEIRRVEAELKQELIKICGLIQY